MASKRKKLAPSNRPSLFAAEDDADESHHDPYSDVDCEFGSDTNYDPDGVQESESRSDKINGFIDMLTRNFRDVYYPDKELSLDESLMLYKGRLIFRTYMKNKKTKYGIKFYVLTSHDGYVLSQYMYSGKTDVDDESRTGGKTIEKLVLRLMRPYLLKGHELYMDNYYNSVPLSEKLLDLKTHTCGTLISNRKGNPTFLAKKKLKKDEYIWLRKGKVYVSNWRDKRQVLMLTTLDQPEMVKVRNKRGQEVKKPKEIAQYNRFMSGIDRADQMISYYSCPRKTIRWYKKNIFHMLDVAT
ncbi:hypothetical protein HF086_016288 [Spodoptera exigua]|uniref:PiggyBac transposable element-derived protein domain-containing protein n=1 Tax=Spodoptera exigua TaxID=7107 RepID=A0A922MIC2_SPOEX|nr:hypothetical protein HF086_016288 [Spodoptera exigua]